ncbi:hypothetical protein CDL12_19218 [Handroanthus impetiginosus]|uniref:Uncharacterized protein n=1 Tax=Handroanthus impetiginosus TaxID=429701 RepID=A0A2G9GSE8_9LAMI|nr:hypothetical protein CDL12_19218 [Handroanthus impetiginosus]
MKKGCRRMWWVVPCRSKKSLKRESSMDIQEILNMKLETIKEEPDENKSLSKKMKKKKIHFKKPFISELIRKESYIVFMTGFASKSGLTGLPIS